ncbi:ATP-binding protein [Streptococcus gordonii]|uniref:ATP-binding protein n=1 Tax=Streptococcus gordonii TaxID=1302 RepID=UPI000B0ADA2D|nr:ATP-binding protein [Streptococcus gordonii]MCG4823452.1 ATP-binding protein [Streptococcus gordonii]MCG4848919.1 ATP-binding protein [Streptococcus gordonii]MDE8687376.1 ATP-binding protein [Streptococcus gordonii]
MDNQIIKGLEGIAKKFSNNKNEFYPYIDYIRFPHYKSLSLNSKINFDFPITLLVGKNGVNKTSILQALYGSPANKSVSEYWFSTNVDYIDEGEGKQCLIYSYFNEKASRNVEVLKGRSGTAKGLDYWEPYAPQKQYGMERLRKNEYIGSSSTDRWDGIEKNVVFCDCKEYVSAFDLFFYHYNFKKISTQRSKQDFIRLRSKPVADILKNNTTSYTRYKKEMVIDNVKVNDKVCEIISKIMDESYTDIQILTHRLYSKGDGIKASKTIWMKKSGREYSEAFAGTGEARIILLVNDIINAKSNSLILIDEPEISLHPSAIYKFKEFLLQECSMKKHQIIITTHSTQLIKDFPREAVKLLVRNGGKVDIIENIDYQDAFFELGDVYDDKKMIYVEDRLAKYILDFVISHSGSENLKKNLIVRYIPGGANQIISNHILNSSFLDSNNHYFWLDGDQNTKVSESNVLMSYLKNGVVISDKIPEADNGNLDNIIREITGCSIKFKVSGNKGKINDNELIDKQRNFINFWSKYVSYLPFLTPEAYLARLCDKIEKGNYDFSNDQNGKEYFKKRAQKELGLEDIQSDDIFQEQRRAVSKILTDSDMFSKIKDQLEKLF